LLYSSISNCQAGRFAEHRRRLPSDETWDTKTKEAAKLHGLSISPSSGYAIFSSGSASSIRFANEIIAKTTKGSSGQERNIIHAEEEISIQEKCEVAG
jgi:hypothetical protein